MSSSSTPTAGLPTLKDRLHSTASRLIRSTQLYSVLSISVLFLLWFAVTQWFVVASNLLPAPLALFKEFLVISQTGYAGTSLSEDIFASVWRMILGFSLSAIIAVPVGIAMGMSIAVRGLLAPVFNGLRPVPSIGLIPLMVLWFGIGQTSKVAVIFLASFLFVVLNTAEGVRSVPVGLIRAAANLGAGRLQMFWRIVLPASLPAIFTGLKTGLAVSWAVVVAAELLGAQHGLGFMIEDAATFYRIKVVYIGLILIGLIGLAMTAAINTLERRIVHWVGKS